MDESINILRAQFPDNFTENLEKFILARSKTSFIDSLIPNSTQYHMFTVLSKLARKELDFDKKTLEWLTNDKIHGHAHRTGIRGKLQFMYEMLRLDTNTLSDKDMKAILTKLNKEYFHFTAIFHKPPQTVIPQVDDLKLNRQDTTGSTAKAKEKASGLKTVFTLKELKKLELDSYMETLQSKSKKNQISHISLTPEAISQIPIDPWISSGHTDLVKGWLTSPTITEFVTIKNATSLLRAISDKYYKLHSYHMHWPVEIYQKLTYDQ
jgi:hypothetical protein